MGRSLQVQSDQIDYVKSRVKFKGFPSQSALAMELGLSRATVSNYLNGKPVDYLNFVEISEKLGLSWLEISLQDEPMKKDGILVKKKVSALNREININFKDLFKNLTKALVDSKLGNLAKLPGDLIDTISSVNLDLNSSTIAWLLIFRALNRSIYSLVEDNKELFKSEYKNFDAIEDLIEFSLEEKEIIIDRSFFHRPKDLSILKEIKTPFQQWLQLYGLNESQATSICNRLPSYFVFALNDEWRDREPEYAQLHKHLVTPFSEVGNKEQSWLRYSAWLQKQVDEPMFSEAFSLRQVYVEPRAYYEQEIKNDKEQDDNFRQRDKKEYKKIVVELENYLDTWLETANQDDAIKIISGDPGAGKSSFTKMLAAKIAEKQTLPVLFIPLHHFDPTGDLVEAIGRFVRDDDDISHNPLAGDFKESRLLIIFDGLDELSMQGKLGAEVARSFINEVQKTVSRINYRQIHLQVIISGRPIVISSNRDEIRKSEQILHILPYFIPKNKRNDYQDKHNLLAEDRRDLWWQKYGEVTGHHYQKMPDELTLDNLLEITTQPLLNYLVALSYVRSQNPDIDRENKIVFSPETNLNTIYQDLLKSVYDRGWETKQHPHPTLKGIIYENFVRILEEISLAAWHGNGRTTTIKEIESRCESSGLKRLLKNFTKGAEIGFTNLLTSFYFHQIGYSNDDDLTFEFTHRSFGEYLTARRIVRELANINEELQRREDEFDKGWDEKQALTKWITICGMSAIDEYLFDFISNEIFLREREEVQQWQQTLCHLISFVLRYGMPMEQINPRPSYKEELRRSKNAEEALLIVLNGCARYTEIISNINWKSNSIFREWLHHIDNLYGRSENNTTFIKQYLSFLNLREAMLLNADLYYANLYRTNLEQAYIPCANLSSAFLYKTNLYKANLGSANLEMADLTEANLCKADLQNANLDRANLEGANLENADLRDANLEGANLKNACLKGVMLDGAKMDKKLLQQLKADAII